MFKKSTPNSLSLKIIRYFKKKGIRLHTHNFRKTAANQLMDETKDI